MVYVSVLLWLAAAEVGTAENPSVSKHVLILGESPRAALAVSKAKQLAAKSGLPYGTRGLIVDNTGQLRWPKDWTDSIYAGGYYLRRMDNDCTGDSASEPTPSALGSCITVEKAEAYGLPGKGFVIVAGIVSDDEAAARLPLLRQKLGSVRDHVTSIYMGCIH